MSKTSTRRPRPHSENTLEVDPQMLKRAKEILGLDSDAEAMNHALSALIVNDEMETAIESAFRTVPYFKTS